MINLKQTLDSYFLSFIKENGLESLEEKMIETITKCEYEIEDKVERFVDMETHNACVEVEHEVSYLHDIINDLEEDYRKLKESKDDFFTPQTLEDEFKIQWIKDNWDNIKPL
jgi:rubrerythrin